MSDAEAILSNPALIVGLVIVVALEFGLMLWGLLDWVKRPAEQVRGNRILWLLLIILVNIIGPIVYLTVGRLPAPASETLGSPAADRARTAADALYGPGGDDASRG